MSNKIKIELELQPEVATIFCAFLNLCTYMDNSIPEKLGPRVLEHMRGIAKSVFDQVSDKSEALAGLKTIMKNESREEMLDYFSLILDELTIEDINNSKPSA